MNPADGDGTDPEGSGQPSELPPEPVNTQLFEAMVHLLIEKGVLTKNDALSIVQTVAEVQRSDASGRGEDGAQNRWVGPILQRMYESFDALADRPGALQRDLDNVRSLRPPVHGNRPRFPRDD